MHTEDKEETLVLAYDKAFTKYRECPECKFKTFSLSGTEILQHASDGMTGKARDNYVCINCSHRMSEIRVISASSSSSDSSSSSGRSSSSRSSSFGGGRSSGGGAQAGGGEIICRHLAVDERYRGPEYSVEVVSKETIDIVCTVRHKSQLERRKKAHVRLYIDLFGNGDVILPLRGKPFEKSDVITY